MDYNRTKCCYLTRRQLLSGLGLAAIGASATQAKPLPLQIGITDWNLNLGANPDSVAMAARLGFPGVQVSFGRKLVNGKMPVDNRDAIAKYLQLAKQHNVTIDATCVDRLHDNGLKSDPKASRWVSDSIRLTKSLNAQILLVPFFGPWAIKTQREMDRVGDLLRELAPEAEQSGVILGLENTISAQDNVAIMQRSQSKNVLVYYDVGNSTLAGFKPAEEIRWLGKDRICQFHLKDNPHLLGEGSIQFRPILEAIRDIQWTGWANLETDVPASSLATDLKRNLNYIQNIETSVYS